MPKLRIVMCAWLTCSVVVADDAAPPKSLEPWVKYYTEVAKGYDVRLQSEPDKPLAVSAEPVLVYVNPTIGFDTHGAFFVWTRNGRAEAIAAIWSKRQGVAATSLKNVNHEFHSLAAEPLVAKGKDGVKWTPQAPGLEFRLVPNGPPPAATRARRLAQMREISRQFTGYDLNPREGGEEEVERQLRVLGQPLYRFAEQENPTGDPVEPDGAVFGLFLDWDPEILLVLEIRETREGFYWHYAVAYVDYKPLRLEHAGREVWSKPEKNFGSANDKYYCVIGVTTRPVELKWPDRD
jgi:hypothetical protein